MANIDDLRKQYPNLAGYSDRELTQMVSQQMGVTPEYVNDQLGIKKNTAGAGTDLAVDVGRGLVGIGRAATGIANLATRGAVGEGIRAVFGGDLGDVDRNLATKYSDKRLDAQDEVDNAHGFVDTTKAYLSNPGLMLGEGIQGVTGMVAPVGVAGKLAGLVEKRLAIAAAERGLTGEAAAKFIADGVKSSTAASLAAPTAFGVTAAGQAADEANHNNPNDMTAMYGSAAAAGLLNMAGMHYGAKLPGGGAMQSFATGGTLNRLEGNMAGRTALAVANQGGTNAAINAGSTVGANVSSGREWDQGVAQSAVSGMLGGAPFGLAHGVMHGAPKLSVDMEGNIKTDRGTVAPNDLPAHLQERQLADQQAEQARQEQLQQQQTIRQVIAQKYGVKDRTYVSETGQPVKDGYDFAGVHYPTEDALNAAIDKLAAKESSKPIGQSLGEIALANVMRNRGVEDITPSTLYKADGSIKDAAALVSAAESEHAVLGRVTKSITDTEKAVAGAVKGVDSATKRLEKIKQDAEETGKDDKLAGATKSLESAQKKVTELQNSLGFYNDWAQALRDHTGAKNGEIISESTNRSNEVVGKTNEGTDARVTNDATSKNSEVTSSQRPELDVLAQQPRQETQVTEAPKTPVVEAPPTAKPVVEALPVAKVEVAPPVVKNGATLHEVTEIPGSLTALADKAKGMTGDTITTKNGTELRLVSMMSGDEHDIIAFSGDKFAGALSFGKGMHPDVHVEQQFRRNGIATALYDHAQKLGGDVFTGNKLRTPDGEAFRTAYNKANGRDATDAPTPPKPKITLKPRDPEKVAAADNARSAGSVTLPEKTVTRSRKVVSADTIAQANETARSARAAAEKALNTEPPPEATNEKLTKTADSGNAPVANKKSVGAERDSTGDIADNVGNKVTRRNIEFYREHTLDGATHDEIAERHGVSKTTVTESINGLKDRLEKEGHDSATIDAILKNKNEYSEDTYHPSRIADSLHRAAAERSDVNEHLIDTTKHALDDGNERKVIEHHDEYDTEAPVDGAKERSIVTDGMHEVEKVSGSTANTKDTKTAAERWTTMFEQRHALEVALKEAHAKNEKVKIQGKRDKKTEAEITAMLDDIEPKLAKLEKEMLREARNNTEKSKAVTARGEIERVESGEARRDHAMDRMVELGRKDKSYKTMTVEQFYAKHPEEDTFSESALSKDIKTPRSTDERLARMQEAQDRVHKMLAERKRTEAEHDENNALLDKVVEEQIRPMLEESGIGHARDFIDSFDTMEMPVADNGMIGFDKSDNTTHIIIAAKLIDAARTGDVEAVSKLHQTVLHEIGHGVDESARGGVYSAQPEMAFQEVKGGVVPKGEVARELVKHYNDDALLSEKLGYPLSKDFDGSHDPVKTAKELFAQVWGLYHNADTRAYVEALLPKTASYLSEVSEHVKNTPTEVRSKTTAGAERLRTEFTNRNADRAASSSDSMDRVTAVESNEKSDKGTNQKSSNVTSESAARSGDANGSAKREWEYSRDASAITPEQRKAVIDSNIERLPAALQKPVRGLTANITHFATRGLQSSAFLHDLADWGNKHGLPAMKEISRLFAEKGALKSELDKKLGSIAEMFDKLQPKMFDRLTKGQSDDQKAVGTFLRDAQFAHDRKWGFVPEWKLQGMDEKKRADWIAKNVAGEKEAATKDWNKLSPAAQQVVEAILRHNDETRRAMQEEFDRHINEMHDERLKLAGDDEVLKAGIEDDRAKALRDVKMRHGDHPYSPIKRFGDHVVTVQSKEMQELRKDPEVNRKQLRDMEQDPEHYQVMHYDSAGEAANEAKALQDKYGDSHVVEASEKTRLLELGTQSHEVLQHMAEAASRNADSDFATAINNTLSHAIIKSMGEATSRTSDLHRKLISGMKPEEMIRAFITNGFSDNAMLSAVKHNRAIADQMKTLDSQVRGGDAAGRGARTSFYNEIQERRINAAKMEPPAPWVSHAMRFTSTWKLITSPAYYLQYISQPLTMAAPVLQGRHGYAAGMKALMHGLRDSHQLMKVAEGQGKLHGEEGGRLTEMLKSLKGTGTISLGHTEQFGRYHNRPEGSFSREWIRATDKMSQLPHTVEMHNRIGTAVGAYKLEYAKALHEGATKDVAHKQAVDYARDSINIAYGDYSSYNAPRIMSSSPMRKLMFQYRQFQAIHGAMLVRALNQAFKGESVEVRKAARLQLAYMSGHYGVLAGAMGIPGAHLVAGAIKQVFGDDDVPEDTNTFIKRHVGDGAFGKMFTEGIPGLMGMKLSNRMGAGDIFSLFHGDATVTPGSKKEYSDLALAVAGPFFGAMVPQVIDGVSRIGKGDYYRGLEQLMPKGLSDVMKASRYATEGVSNRKGDTTLSANALDGGDIMAQALGAAPLKIADAQAVKAATYKFEQHFKDQVNELSFRFNQARKAGEPVDDIVAAWKKMQEVQRREGFKPTPLSSLYTAPVRQMKRERATMGGVEYTKNNRNFVRSMIGEE